MQVVKAKLGALGVGAVVRQGTTQHEPRPVLLRVGLNRSPGRLKAVASGVSKSKSFALEVADHLRQQVVFVPANEEMDHAEEEAIDVVPRRGADRLSAGRRPRQQPGPLLQQGDRPARLDQAGRLHRPRFGQGNLGRSSELHALLGPDHFSERLLHAQGAEQDQQPIDLRVQFLLLDGSQVRGGRLRPPGLLFQHAEAAQGALAGQARGRRLLLAREEPGRLRLDTERLVGFRQPPESVEALLEPAPHLGQGGIVRKGLERLAQQGSNPSEVPGAVQSSGAQQRLGSVLLTPRPPQRLLAVRLLLALAAKLGMLPGEQAGNADHEAATRAPSATQSHGQVTTRFHAAEPCARLARVERALDRLAAAEPPQVVGQGAGVGVAPRGLLVQALEADGFQVARHPRVELPGRGGLVLHHLEQGVGDRGRLEGGGGEACPSSTRRESLPKPGCRPPAQPRGCVLEPAPGPHVRGCAEDGGRCASGRPRRACLRPPEVADLESNPASGAASARRLFGASSTPLPRCAPGAQPAG